MAMQIKLNVVAIRWIVIYPMDSFIHLSNSKGLIVTVIKRVSVEYT